MSSTLKETESVDGKQSVEMKVDESIIKSMSIEPTDGHNNGKKTTKKKKLKSSPSNQSNKKPKKDPNKPEYPRVGTK